MRLLLSNDDGYAAPGLRALMREMAQHGEISVVAPDRNRSGASNSLTLGMPLRVQEHGDGVISVEGTPTDCVHLGITGLLEVEPDMVISGVNSGANLGDDVLYSGTVAAAMEGRFLGLPAIAVSCIAHLPSHLDTAAKVAGQILTRLQADPLPADTILNVNVPDVPYAQIKGFQATRLGQRHKAEPLIRDKDPRGQPLYWIGPPGAGEDAGPGTDFHAVTEGYVSVTPLHVDLTRYTALDQVAGWVQGL